MKTAATSPTYSSDVEKADQAFYDELSFESDELAAAKAELEQVRAQLYGVLDGVRAAFSAENGIVQALAEAEQIDEVADSLLEILCEAFEFDTATFWLLDPEDGKLCALAHRPTTTRRTRFLEAKIQSLQLPVNEGIAGRVFVERKVYLSDDAPSVSERELGLLLQADGLRTVCAFAVMSAGTPLGVIEMERREPLAPDHAIESAVRVIGDRIGAFIEFSQLHWRYFSLVNGLNHGPRKSPEPEANVVPLKHAA
jgi:transcriptional regulator with GAF, ATPase, and Fis domain